MDIGEVLNRAWDITWKNKGLWLLGILAGCSTGGGGNPGGNLSSTVNYNLDNQDFAELGQFFENIPDEVWTGIGISVIALIVLGIVLGLLLFVLGIIGQGGLYAGFNRADQDTGITFGEAFQLGLKNFWKLLGIRLIYFVGSLIVLGALGVFFVLAAILTFGIGLICSIPLICLLIPIFIAVGIYIQLTQVAAVVEDSTIPEAFRAAWELVRQKVGDLIAIGVILVIGGGFAGVIISLPFMAIVIPPIITWATGVEHALTIGLGLAALVFLIVLPFYLVFNGILQTFINGAWTITYRRLTGKAVEA